MLAAALGLAASLAGAAAGAAPSLVLERVVAVERHGVRSPTKPPEALSRYSAQPWPAWPVGPGELTPHGAENVRLMGAWLRRAYAREGLLPAAGCPAPGAVYVWADGADQRTRMSGQALLDGAFPGCGLAAAHGPEGRTDPLFDGISSGACPIDAEKARAAILAEAGGDLARPGPGYEAAKAALAEVLSPRPPACPDDAGACFLHAPNALAAKGGQVRMEGALGVAATLTESLFLEYEQGMPASAVGWGRAGSPARIAAIMPLHEIDADLMRRTPYMASHNGAPMARAVADAVDGRPAVPAQSEPAPALLVIAGHDTNLSNLAGVLGLDWTLPGQPDKTPPDGALVFEVWRAPDGARFVKAAFVYQSLAQLRNATPLDEAHPAGRVPLTLPGCADGPGGACSLATFQRRIEAAVPADCRR